MSALCAAIGAAAVTALVLVAVAHAGARTLTWQQAAARVDAPVYRPRVTLGIKPQTLVVNRGGCLIGAWGPTNTGKGPHFSIDEPGVTSQCGQPGEALLVVRGQVVEAGEQMPDQFVETSDGERRGEFGRRGDLAGARRSGQHQGLASGGEREVPKW